MDPYRSPGDRAVAIAAALALAFAALFGAESPPEPNPPLARHAAR